MTNKEKYLLMFLAGLIVIAIYWFAIYSPLQDKTVALKSEVQTLNDELTYVSLEYAKKDSYEEETTNARAYIQKVNNRFPAGLTQEAVIYTMKSLEEAIDSLTIQSYTIGDTEVIIQNEEYTSTEEETGYERVVKVPVNVNFQTSYNDYKKILSYIQTYPSHLSLGNMTANSDLQNNLVLSSFSIFFYALESSERPFEPTDYFGPFEPKEGSIFSPFNTLGINYDPGVAVGEVREADDIVLGITSINSVLETVSIHRATREEDTSITADNPNNEPIEIWISQEDGQYYYRYRTSSTSYPANYEAGESFDPGSMIDLKVISSRRYNDADVSGVNATIINDTDLPMIVRLEYEDVNRPRFNIVEQRGNITIR